MEQGGATIVSDNEAATPSAYDNAPALVGPKGDADTTANQDLRSGIDEYADAILDALAEEDDDSASSSSGIEPGTDVTSELDSPKSILRNRNDDRREHSDAADVPRPKKHKRRIQFAEAKVDWSDGTHTCTPLPVILNFLAVVFGALIFVWFTTGVRQGVGLPTSPFLDDSLVPSTALTTWDFSERRGAAYVTPSLQDADAKLLFEQYARMRYLCWNITQQLGFSVRELDAVHSEEPMCYRPLFGKPGTPFFCINVLLDQFAAGDILTIHEQQQHRVRSVERLRDVLPVDNIDLVRQIAASISAHRTMSAQTAPDAMRPFDDIGSASNVQMGYLEEGVILRDLAALDDNVARLTLLRYDDLGTMARRMHESPGTVNDAACACGLYGGFPRAMALSRHRNHTVLLLDPQILNAYGSEHMFSDADLPWHKRPLPGYPGLRRWSSAALGVAGEKSSNKYIYYQRVDVLSMKLVPGPDGSMRAETVRKISNLEGSAAYCVQHCALIALAWADAADASPPSLDSRLLI